MIDDALAEIGRALDARAAGLWKTAEGGLVQTAFWPAPDLPRDVAEEFALATVRVPSTETGLGIVQAALDGRPGVSIVDDLPPDSGSGLWLRRFGADRSVAVPVQEDGRIVAIASVALPDGSRSVEDVAARMASLAAWFRESAVFGQTPRGTGRGGRGEEQ